MTMFTGLKAALAVLTVTASSWAAADDKLMQEVLAGEHRAASSVRDEYRHPGETLAFFGLEPDMTVVEIAPGGGWYTEILAPYLREKGTFYAAHFDPDSSVGFYRKSRAGFAQKLAASPELYDRTQVTVFELPDKLDIAPEGSADMVLTFRNVHNWYMNGGGEERVTLAFRAFYRALKPVVCWAWWITACRKTARMRLRIPAVI